ncbi:MAG: NifU family protein [Verrucomicrobia bacterium]|nr:NifU family protein [Verrucomicrobiota bacterium]MDA1087278.1 NifU family protein [Verrucomicrobiota bacterium]
MSLQIFEQPTPNPYAMKYILSEDVLSHGKMTFTDAAKCAHVPLAVSLLAIDSVSQVHFFENVITVTRVESGSGEQIIMDTIRAGMDGHNPDINDQEEEERTQSRAGLSDDQQRIEAILDEKIRPALQMDGGDLDVVRYDPENHRLLVAYQGACGGCPSASAGTLMAIQGILRDDFDPDIEVIPDESGAVPYH